MLKVILLSIGMTVMNHIRRKFTVERPVKRITDATSKMIEGDFSVRIEPIAKFATDDSFNEIIECINKMAEELSKQLGHINDVKAATRDGVNYMIFPRY